MKTVEKFWKSICFIAVLSFLISSCSEQKYTYYDIDKKKSGKLNLEKPQATPLSSDNKKGVENIEMEKKSWETVDNNKETPVTTSKKEKGALTKKVNKVVGKTLTAPFEIVNNTPEKISRIFSRNNNTMSDNENGHSNLLWTIVAVVLILWLLGFLVGDLGNIIHLLLVVALILIILNLLGV